MSQEYAQQEYTGVNLQYVGVGRRFLAVFLDAIIINIITGILGTILGSNNSTLTSIISVVLNLGYFIVLEAVLEGGTLGKKALGIKVVRLDGTPISWSESAIRNVLRIIDFIPLAYLLGAILVWTSDRKQRLGDRVAKTVVVRA